MIFTKYRSQKIRDPQFTAFCVSREQEPIETGQIETRGFIQIRAL